MCVNDIWLSCFRLVRSKRFSGQSYILLSDFGCSSSTTGMTQACNPSHSGLRPEDHKIVFSWGTLARRSQYKRAGDTAQWSSACLHMPDPSSVLEKESPFAVQRKLKGVKRGRKEELLE